LDNLEHITLLQEDMMLDLQEDMVIIMAEQVVFNQATKLGVLVVVAQVAVDLVPCFWVVL
jgi:hypothetical protein